MADEGGHRKRGNRTGGNLTSPVRIAAQERVNRALELRKAGVHYRVIAEKCGYKTASHAHKACKAAILALPRDNAEETKQFEAERLDRMLLSIWERTIKGDVEAMDRVLKIMARRAALMGLDAPTAFVDATPKSYEVGNGPGDLTSGTDEPDPESESDDPDDPDPESPPPP